MIYCQIYVDCIIVAIIEVNGKTNINIPINLLAGKKYIKNFLTFHKFVK